MKNSNYIFYATCLLTNGASRSLISDTQRSEFCFIPNAMYHLLKDFKGKKINEILNQFPTNANEIEDYFNFLIENEYIFLINEEIIECFSDIEMDWDYPSKITNIIIEDIFNIDLLKQFKSLNIKNVEIRIFHKILNSNDIIFINNAIDFGINEINITINHELIDDFNIFIDILKECKIVKNVIIYNSNNINTISFPENGCNVYFVSSKYISEHNCGKIDLQYFTNNIQHFTESQHHNTCLNRKISIDANGEIKNCPSMAKSYGNIKDTKLIDVVNNPEFQKVWHIKKDEITKCKDCEFRHICTDCRAYLENPEDQYSAPLKCGYDPYTCEWEDWSTNPLKEKAIEFYGMQELVKK